MEKDLRDFVGNRIKVDSFIAYCIRDGNSSCMKLGVIQKLDFSKKTPVIHVQGFNKNYNGEIVKQKLLSKLTEVDRIIVLDAEMLDDDVYFALSQF